MLVKVLMIGESGVGKCIVGDSLVFGANKVQKIKNVAIGDEVYSVNCNKIDIKTVSNTVMFRNQRTIYIETKDGYCIEGTPEHKVLVYKNGSAVWKALDDIQVGDEALILAVPIDGATQSISGSIHVHSSSRKLTRKLWSNELTKKYGVTACGTPRETGYVDIKVKVDENIAKLIAFLIAEGHISHAQRRLVRITNTDENVLNFVKNVCLNYFKYDARIYNTKSRSACPEIALDGLYDVFKFINKQTIPDIIFNSPLSVKKAFVDAYIKADGYISAHGSIEVYTKYLSFARDFQKLLLTMGHYSSIRQKVVYGKPYYRIIILKGSKYDRYHKFIKFGDTVALLSKVTHKEYRQNDVFDVTVPKTHNYIANGFVSHNTHTCIEVAKVIKSVIIDVDEGAEPIIQKLNAEETVTRLDGASFKKFAESLKQAVKSDAEMIIIDSLTELKEAIKRHIKDKILQKGEFYIGGIERDEPKRVADRDLFVLTWELHPPVYDKIRDIMRLINSSGKSFIMTYHPHGDRVSSGEAKILSELIRICDIVAQVTQDGMILKKDRYFNLKEISREDFVEYLKTILQAKHINDVKEFVEGLI